LRPTPDGPLCTVGRDPPFDAPGGLPVTSRSSLPLLFSTFFSFSSFLLCCVDSLPPKPFLKRTSGAEDVPVPL